MESQDLILNLCSEFVNCLAKTSNQVRRDYLRVTINESHVREALQQMDLNCYVAKIMKMEESQIASMDEDQLDKEFKRCVLRKVKTSPPKLSKEEEEKLNQEQKRVLEQIQKQHQASPD